ncbi:16S rRNA (cytosine(1402)-N(4))-methyltransferase RsmH [Gluconacetobacter diazotrophicus]|uniref:Ribosomal RNA small subunit methyltransferase H n=1 Tax=Gluconacetobacter diazotrophicus TaxID=33996 RepID=A0A7W4I7V2_GLUDI|nr:16S rRNA (cytosine(1402)-N(4))-methyltransferase RsmH [Gluconacetobacter diazotrophicus]MBB2157892.1 16S rRNA (cytosine(1402)-N(4))-methyltransferase RsmH [Gluconacetobacter diazotrophicus]
MSTIPTSGHIPVMLAEVLEMLCPRDGATYLDGTFGGGGYARAILGAARCTLWAIDRDPAAIRRGQALQAELRDAEGGMRLHMLQGGFGDMQGLLAESGVHSLDGVVLDLGVSSFQLDEVERGFSFRTDGPLDMRMGDTGPTAADIVNTMGESDLADIIYEYGEERMSRRVARAIVAARAQAPITTTFQLADIIRSVVPGDRSGIDPATRSFQGIRIHVNDELGQIVTGLEQALALLAPGGRLVVVSFHSLEDRLVKQALNRAAGRMPGPSRHDPRSMRAEQAAPDFQLLTSRALRPGETECRANPRARSARLRAAERLAVPNTQNSTHNNTSPQERRP